MRKIIIYSLNNPNSLIPENIKKKLIARNTEIQYIPVKTTNDELIELYGYDTTLKYSSKNISSRTKLINVLKTIIGKIDKMPMGSSEKTIRNKMNQMNKMNKMNQMNQMNNINRTRKRLLKKCGLPNVAETQHCFADTTHHTCCMLGPKSREYADSSGNPIGSISVKVQKSKTKTSRLSPWCTCTGSKVCSYYTNKFGKDNGTHIKFISTGKNNDKNENKAISEMGFMKHRTPGIM
jgi:hypothetical protein